MGANGDFYNSPNSWPYTNFHELNLDWILEKLKKLEKVVINDDLFHFASQDNERKIEEVKAKFTSLERDEFPIPAFPEYINKIKNYI